MSCFLNSVNFNLSWHFKCIPSFQLVKSGEEHVRQREREKYSVPCMKNSILKSEEAGKSESIKEAVKSRVKRVWIFFLVCFLPTLLVIFNSETFVYDHPGTCYFMTKTVMLYKCTLSVRSPPSSSYLWTSPPESLVSTLNSSSPKQCSTPISASLSYQCS